MFSLAFVSTYVLVCLAFNTWLLILASKIKLANPVPDSLVGKLFACYSSASITEVAYENMLIQLTELAQVTEWRTLLWFVKFEICWRLTCFKCCYQQKWTISFSHWRVSRNFHFICCIWLQSFYKNHLFVNGIWYVSDVLFPNSHPISLNPSVRIL